MGRPNGGIVTGLLVVSILAGCSTSEPIVYVKPGVTASQQKADRTACFEASIGAIQDPRPSPLPPVDREAYARCMQTKGYTPAQK
jgi:hypothetical protein